MNDLSEDLDELLQCIDRVRAGNVDAVAELYDRYFALSVRRANTKLYDGERPHIDEEVAAKSALDSLVHRMRRGAYGDINDQISLWRLLATIIDRKVIKYRREMSAQARTPDRPILNLHQFNDDSSDARGPLPVNPRDHSPLSNVIAQDTLNRLLEHLTSAGARQVLLLRLEGFSDLEIADRLQHSRRWVQRRCLTIREVASSLLNQDL